MAEEEWWVKARVRVSNAGVQGHVDVVWGDEKLLEKKIKKYINININININIREVDQKLLFELKLCFFTFRFIAEI